MSIMSGASGHSLFRYRSVTGEGAIRLGELHAQDFESASRMLRARHEWPIELTCTPADKSARRSMSIRDLGVGLRVLATILEARVAPAKVMMVSAPSLPIPWQQSVPAMSAALENGDTFSAAVRSGGIDMPIVVDGLMRAGEAAGDLAGALRRGAEVAEQSAATRAAVVDALAYPVLLLAAGTGVIGLLVAVVIPRFTEVLTNLGQELPVSTRIVLGVASLIRAGLIPSLLVCSLAAIVFARWHATTSGRQLWHAWLLSVPVVGAVRHAFGTSRVTNALAALIDCGMPVAQALPYAAASGGDAAIESRLLAARQRVLEGESFASALGVTHALTPSATRLIGAGEAGGALTALLRHASALENDRASMRTRSTLRIIEPALIVVLGFVVSGVAVALLQAVYSVRVDRL